MVAQGALQRGRFELLEHIATVFEADDALRATLEDCITYTSNDRGDITFKGFELREALDERNPVAIAQRIATSNLPDYVTAEMQGPFLNFRLDNAWVAQNTIADIDENYGMQPVREGEKPVIVEYGSPNHGKPLHVGHIRSTVVGESNARLLETQGHNVIRINYPGSVGEHMGKVIVGLQEWENGELPDDPGEAMTTMSRVYVQYGNAVPSGKNALDDLTGDTLKTALRLQAAAKQRNHDIENGVGDVVTLWERIMVLSEEQHSGIFGRLGVEFDYIQPASIAITKGKEMVQQALGSGVATMYEGAPSVSRVIRTKAGGEKEVHQKIQAADGSAVYATLDLGIAAMRAEELGFCRMIYVVGTEQGPYFANLFATEEAMKLDYADCCEHLATGHLVLPEGKMGSRTGNVFLLEDVLDSAVTGAKQMMAEKQGISSEDIDTETAEAIGIGAFVYNILLAAPGTKITYSEENALGLQGKSAPFAQYSYARAGSVLRKAGTTPTEYNPEVLEHKSEHALLREMARLPMVFETAARKLAPQIVAEYIHRLGSAYNRFYNNCHIKSLGADQQELRDARLVLTDKYRKVMSRALDVLNIKVVERM